MGVTAQIIELHIEELILEGVDASARDGIGEALHAALSQLLTERAPSFAGDASLAQVAAAPLGVSMQASPQRLGAAIATSVHESLVP